jgi:hypothetical protein
VKPERQQHPTHCVWCWQGISTPTNLPRATKKHERDRGREGERERGREKKREREIYREKERERERKKENEREREREGGFCPT